MRRLSRGLFYSVGGFCCRSCFNRWNRKRKKAGAKKLVRRAVRTYYKKEVIKEIKNYEKDK